MNSLHYIWYPRLYFYHWVDTSAGWLVVLDGIIRSVVTALALKWFSTYISGADPGVAHAAPPPPPPHRKIGKNMICWRKIVIFHTKYPQNFATPSAIGKNMIFWRKIVIFHTKYPKNFRTSLRNWKKYDFLA